MSACGNCGGDPVGEGCYHICFNSPAYYSPEQERYDDAHDFGYDDHYERYASERLDAELWAEGEEEAYYANRDAEEESGPPPDFFPAPRISATYDDDGDIPF